MGEVSSGAQLPRADRCHSHGGSPFGVTALSVRSKTVSMLQTPMSSSGGVQTSWDRIEPSPPSPSVPHGCLRARNMDVKHLLTYRVR